MTHQKRKSDTPHRRVFKKVHGRAPKPGYHIHHIDGNYQNNDPSNLVELTAKEHFDIHKSQGDYGACILLATAAGISPEELASLQQLHGRKCATQKIGIHGADWDRQTHLAKIWEETPPGRKPVTDGNDVLKLKTNEEVSNFLSQNPAWRKGYPEHCMTGLGKSKRRITSEESKTLAAKRLTEGRHNFTIQYTCPKCGTQGKGPMMKRWHFDNCKQGEYYENVA